MDTISDTLILETFDRRIFSVQKVSSQAQSRGLSYEAFKESIFAFRQMLWPEPLQGMSSERISIMTHARLFTILLNFKDQLEILVVCAPESLQHDEMHATLQNLGRRDFKGVTMILQDNLREIINQERYDQVNQSAVILISIKNYLSSVPVDISYEILIHRLQLDIILLIQKYLLDMKHYNEEFIPEDQQRETQAVIEAVLRLDQGESTL